MIYIVLAVALSVLYVWMVVRIWRGSALLGILSLFFSPVMVFALFKNWGDPDTDIKVPFLLSLVLTGVFYFAFYRDLQAVVAESAAYYRPEEIEQIRQEDPEFAAMIEAEQAKAQAWEESEEVIKVTSVVTPESPVETPAPEVQGEKAEPVDLEVQRIRDLQAIRRMRANRGPIELGPAYAKLATPSHFGFIGAKELTSLARVHGREVGANVLGWVVHERVLMADKQAWFGEVRFDQVGHLQVAGQGDSAALMRAINAISGSDQLGLITDPAYAPRWSASDAMALWVRRVEDGRAVEAVAALPLRHGVLSYAVRIPAASEAELAMRTARLMARESAVGEGWQYDDAPVDSPAKGPTLAEWIVSRSKG